MDKLLIAKLLNGGRIVKASTGKKYAWVRSENGLEKVPLKASEIGRFEGKAGTMRRNRKGGSHRLANGRRYYVKDEVISYKA